MNHRLLAQPLKGVLVFAVLCWLIVFAYFALLDFNFIISDVATYRFEARALIQSGYDWTTIYTVFNHDHVPGYSLLIALFKSLLPFVDYIPIMQAINLVAWLLSIACVYLSFQIWRLSHAALGAALFAVFPLVGVSYTVYPIADTYAILSVAAALLAILRRNYWLLALAVALGPFMHKAVWPILGLMVLIGIWQRRVPAWMLLPIGVPVLLYWAFGLPYADRLFWVLGNYPDFLERRTALPIFDGLLGPLWSGGGLKDWAKSFCLLAVYGLGVWLLIARTWRKEPILLAILVPILLWGTAYVTILVWPLVRFGRLFMIPLWFHLQQTAFSDPRSRLAVLNRPAVWFTLLVLSLLSQFAWAYYIARYFFLGAESTLR